VTARLGEYRFMVSSILSILRGFPRSPLPDEGSGNTDYYQHRTQSAYLPILVGVGSALSQGGNGSNLGITHYVDYLSMCTAILQSIYRGK